MATVNATVVTELREFPLDVEPTGYLFELVNVDGFVLSSVNNPTPEVSFPLVPEGFTYTIRCTRNGVTATETFTIPRTRNDIEVPVTVVVSFA